MELQLLYLLLCMTLLGAATGIFTGLVPGIHVNTLAVLMLSSYPLLESQLSPLAPPGWAPLLVASWVVSASVVHSFVDFVPSVFLGVPSPEEVLNVLPGHRMLLDGRGVDAVSASAVGSLLGALVAGALSLPLILALTTEMEGMLRAATPYVIVATVLLLLLREDPGHDRRWAMLLMTLSGGLGYLCMSARLPEWQVLPGGDVMLPLLTGLFGLPAMLLSSRGGPLPEQDMPERVLGRPMPALKGIFAGAVVGWFPGITATAGSALASVSSPERVPERFISMVASVGSASTVFSLLTLAITGNGRSGTMIVVGDLMGDSLPGPGMFCFCVLTLVVLAASLLGYLATQASGRAMARRMGGMDLGRVVKLVIVFMVALVALMTGPSGLLVMAAGTVLGLLPTAVGVNRVHLAACMLLPVLLFYTGLDPMSI